MSCVTLVKAALARFLFAVHILITVWRVVQQVRTTSARKYKKKYLPNVVLLKYIFKAGDGYWKFAIGILFLIGEGLHSLCYRRGEELKWICPSVVIYLASIVPAIWILELTTNRIELLCLYVQSFDTADALQRSLLMDLLQVC